MVANLSFLPWFVSQKWSSDLSLSRKICWGKKLDLMSLRRNIVNTYYHRDKRSTKSSNSFPAPRKSVIQSSDVRYDNNSHWIGRGNQ